MPGVTGLVFVGVLATILVFVAAVGAFLGDLRTQARASQTVLDADLRRTSLTERAERWLARTSLGRYLRREMTLAGLHYPVWVVVVVGLVATVGVPIVLWTMLAPAFGVLGLVAGWVIVRSWLRRQRERYRDRFVDQIPDLARVLSNATNAGLSIQTAWSVAEREMGQPAKGEINRLNTAVRFGASLEEAMHAVEERLPSREVKVLMSTLVIASRSGGSLVSALRDISFMLDERKETKRAVRSILAQAVSTGYTVILMGLGLIVALNVMMPGTIEKMTQNILGQLALVVGLALFALGYVLIRRMTRLSL